MGGIYLLIPYRIYYYLPHMGLTPPNVELDHTALSINHAASHISHKGGNTLSVSRSGGKVLSPLAGVSNQNSSGKTCDQGSLRQGTRRGPGADHMKTVIKPMSKTGPRKMCHVPGLALHLLETSLNTSKRTWGENSA